ncbi:MAG: hypothetical protein ABWZ83_05530 [Mesorhizobium sp.]
MIKFVVAAIWICVATIGAMIYSFQSSAAKPEPGEERAFFGGLDYVKTEVFSVPVLQSGAIDGYFIGRFVYTVESKKLNKLSIPAESLIVDEVYSYLFSHPEIDFTRTAKVDVDAFRNGIRDAINKRVGDTLVHEVLIEQIDYLSKADIRNNTIRQRNTAERARSKPLDAPAPKH